MTKQISTLKLLQRAARSATPSCAGMFVNVREGAAETRNEKTNPMVCSQMESRSPEGHGGGKTKPNQPISSAREGAGMCGDVQQRASATTHAGDETKPTPRAGDLTLRQVAGARLLALGRSGRAVASEIGVDEHSITRWRRLSAFGSEVRRQHELILAELCRQRRVESVDAYAAVAERVARKYGRV